MENRNGLLVGMCVTAATGPAEREAALLMVDAQELRDGTLGADHGYHTADFVDRVPRSWHHSTCRPEYEQSAFGHR
jgi:hypothetical protein